MHGGKRIGVCFVALCGVSFNALADWTGKGEIGASLASGNSENESANAALEIKNTRENWAHTFGLTGNYASDGSVTNAERGEVRGQSDHTFTERAYWFGAERYEDDRFSAFEFQASLSTGLGYRIVDTERTKFWSRAAPVTALPRYARPANRRTASSCVATWDSSTSSPIRPRSSTGF